MRVVWEGNNLEARGAKDDVDEGHGGRGLEVM